MDRDLLITQLKETALFDFVIIGGGASGLGIAVDAASRGYKTGLFESVDFAKGTSSRSTKLIHGGVRYLAQGNIALVMEALKERGLLLKNARHLFKNQMFIIPNYKWWQGLYYAFGLKVYDVLSGRLSLGKSRLIGKEKTQITIPVLKTKNLQNGVSYQDGQFDDSRLALNLAQTALRHHAVVLNYFKVVDLLKDEANKVCGVKVLDIETNRIHDIKSKVVINATGVFANTILKLNGREREPLKIVPSQGIHLVLDASFLQSDTAIMIPKTSDGRVLFIIPWHGKVVVGTTDTPNVKPKYEPKPLTEEIEFILTTCKTYLRKAPERKDVLSVFVGLRPLVAPSGDKSVTKEISRGHKIIVSETGLLSLVGGKWTTYRKMAEDTVDKAIVEHQLEAKPCVTEHLSLFGNVSENALKSPSHRYVYGSDLLTLETLEKKVKGSAEKLHPKYDYTVSEVIFAITNEMARTVEDILARRIRLLFLDAQAAIDVAPKVAGILAEILQKDLTWAKEKADEFIVLAKGYLIEQ
ncbi:glycerol-3-phosphate dehydrogenase/oxidase [Lacinutrix sp. Hel_I_90]|uniref:glycerol-3-phosphate dehydrogenase/oxidase n=1 Tax=Lacinutrix sp. Hel_I_90 TaxID=1249999 RepID=UPI0005CAF428|nr:glycerol-3-phosphate dehydrogenase/oxidase [Lacinutrix sp. Hel_I_90]